MRWKTSETSVYSLSYHIIWCTKYRRKVLEGNIVPRLKELLLDKASRIGIEIVECEILPDHVHLFVRAIPVIAPQNLIGQLKGYTSHALRQEFSSLKSRLPTLWTRSYYVDSVGTLNEYSIRKYIENQKNH